MLRYNSTPYIEVFQADKKRIIGVKRKRKMETIASHVREREREGFAEYRRKRK